MEALGNLLFNVIMGFVNLLILPWHIFNWIQLETLKEKMNVILLAGMSRELFFIILALILITIAAGIYRRGILRRSIHILETFNGRVGQFAAWFVLLMMLQQVLIIAMGQIFRGNELTFSPLGMNLVNEELQWLSGQLKLYNALLIALASAYTFIEGGHVRVDLIYSAVSKRTKHWMDFFGTLFFFIPSTVLLWWFSWPIMINSALRARPMNIYSSKASFRGFKWESSGTAEFSWVWSFKFLVVVFAGLMFICAIGFLLRNILALLQKDEDIATHYSFEGKRFGGMGMNTPPSS
ncbi:MAG: TRAP transporter small permease subunit [Rhizobiaceae bacterium]|nr:TRAP transporter small permease subunit [Rhizobiaceae bacterium]